MTERERLIEIFKNTKYKAYECTPETTVANQFSAYALCHIVDEFLKKGIMVPPCKVGDKIYELIYDSVQKKRYIYDGDMICEVGRKGFFTCYDGNYEFTAYSAIGKTVFLTREEAEKALKECEK